MVSTHFRTEGEYDEQLSLRLGFDAKRKKIIYEVLGCSIGDLPFVHLGIKVGASSKKKTTSEPILQRCAEKLSNWKS